MSKGTAPLTTKPASGTSYQLDPDQTLRAAVALAKAIEKSQKEIEDKKVNLLAEESESVEEVPLWLVLTAKKHLNDNSKLKPVKIPVPNSLWTSATTRICLITADPPETNRKVYKDLVKHRLFPEDLKPRISKVVAVSKLKTKYKSFESKRQLVAEYDIFLADDRIINLLPQILGKTFYRQTAKRPVPVSLIGKSKDHGKNRKEAQELGAKRNKDGPSQLIGQPFDVGPDIQKALDSTTVHLGPSVTVQIKVAWAGWPAEMVAENVTAVVEGMVAKHVSKGWRGVKSLHIKSPESVALPIWLASELWDDDEAVLNQEAPYADDNFNKPKKERGEGDSPNHKKRKSMDITEEDPTHLKKKIKKEAKAAEAATLRTKESTLRKADLADQKKEARKMAKKKVAKKDIPGFCNPKPDKKVEVPVVSEVATKKSV
ncbi:ribosomal protein L1 [Tothia fuscella]|uniref:Ribosomal protein L1 n=1 Tax=Tothia fuscella TaxID=1048955 RepID=A0A9P4NML5_9PEZI|nr:ribosomal protein L1 [Tothia fuscella]